MTGIISISRSLVQAVRRYTHEERGSKTNEKERSGSDTSLLDNTRRYGGVFLLPELDADEGDEEDGEHGEKGNDAAVRPGILAATPLQG